MTGIQKLQKMGKIMGKYRQAAQQKRLNLTLDQVASECQKYDCAASELAAIYTKQMARPELQAAGII